MADEGTVEGIGESGGDPAQDATATRTDVPVGDSSGSDGKASDDYVQRLQTDHGFAVEQAQNWQKKFGRKNSEYDTVKHLAALSPWADSEQSAEQLVAHLEIYKRLLNDPNGKVAIETFARTGQLPATPNNDTETEDEWMDPEQKEIAALKEELAEIRNRTAQHDKDVLEGRMKSSFDNVFQKFPGLTGELREKVMNGCMRDIRQYGQTDAGRDSLRQMNEDGARAMMLRHLSAEELHEVVDNGRRLHTEEKQGFATHEAPGVSTTGGGGEIVEAGFNAFLAACREVGVDPETNPLEWDR
jgi:hypothetical protein